MYSKLKCDMMHLATLLIITFAVGVYSQNFCEVLLPLANVYCISPREFQLTSSFCNESIFSCPVGAFCTDAPQVCTYEGPAACKLSRACNTCVPGATGTCVSSRQYVSCIDGKPDVTVKNCPASKPYCSMEYDTQGSINVVCTSLIKDIACRDLCPTEAPVTEPPATDPPTTEPPTSPPPPVDECIALGKFKVTADLTCKRYYYCYANEKGGLEKLEYVCPYNTLYDPAKGKCVLEGGNFQCVT